MSLSQLIKYLVYLLILVLPLETRWIIHNYHISGWNIEYLSVSLYIVDLLILGIGGLMIIRARVGAVQSTSFIASIKQNSYIYILTIVLLVLSIFVSNNSLITWYYWFRILLTLIFIWILYTSGIDRRRLALMIVISATIFSLLALFQFVSQVTSENKWLGLAWHDSMSPGTSVVAGMDYRLLRPYGGLPHPNILGGFLVLSCILGFWLITQYINKFNYLYYFLIMAYYINLSVLWFTFSRSAILASFIVFISYIFFIYKNIFVKRIWGHLFFSVIFVIILSFIFQDAWMNRVIIDTSLENMSLVERGKYFDWSMDMISKYPLLGVGIGQHVFVALNLYPGLSGWVYQPVHNIYLLILTEIGIIGMVLLCWLFYLLFKKIDKFKFQFKFSIVSLLCLALLILGIFDHYLWTLHFGVLMVSFVIGFGLVKSIPSQ